MVMTVDPGTSFPETVGRAERGCGSPWTQKKGFLSGIKTEELLCERISSEHGLNSSFVPGF